MKPDMCLSYCKVELFGRELQHDEYEFIRVKEYLDNIHFSDQGLLNIKEWTHLPGRLNNMVVLLDTNTGDVWTPKIKANGLTDDQNWHLNYMSTSTKSGDPFHI